MTRLLDVARPAPGPRQALVALLVVLGLLWAYKIGSIYAAHGLFYWIGVDFRHYYSQAMLLRSGEPGLIYDLEALRPYQESLAIYTTRPTEELGSGTVPYPPIFAWLFIPLTFLAPPLGFAVWVGVNLLALAHIAWRVGQQLPAGQRPWAVALLATSLPVVYALLVGQAMILMTSALTECYLALRAGRDLRAGLWLSLLLLKPHYGVLLGPLLLWKRRWSTVAGVALGGAVLALGSIVLAGPAAAQAFPSSLLDKADLAGSGNFSYPEDMVNWRRLVQVLLPGLGPQSTIGISIVLGILTALAALAAWRGPWQPAERLFPAKMAALLIATILASYHSHAYGPMILAVPLAALLADRPRPLTRAILLATIVLPTLLFTLVRMPAAPFALLLLGCLAALLAECGRPTQRDRASAPDRPGADHPNPATPSPSTILEIERGARIP